MNFARTFGPDLIGGDLTAIWVYLAGPLLGAVVAVAFAFVLRGPGGGSFGSRAAQGTIDTEVANPDAPVPGGPAKPPKSKKSSGKKKKKSKKNSKSNPRGKLDEEALDQEDEVEEGINWSDDEE